MNTRQRDHQLNFIYFFKIIIVVCVVACVVACVVIIIVFRDIKITLNYRESSEY